MAIRICGDNTVASPAITSASDTDTGLQFGTNEVKVVNGNLDITDGNLIVASGHGIDFSDTADSSGTMANELLDDYEEGTWTPSTSQFTHTIDECRYTKIGREVRVSGLIVRNQTTPTPTTAMLEITGFPFARHTYNRSIDGTFWLDNGGTATDDIGGVTYFYNITNMIFASASNPAQQAADRYVSASDVNNTRGIQFVCTYITD